MKIFILLIGIFTFSYGNKTGIGVIILWLKDNNYKRGSQYFRFIPEYGIFNSLDEKRVSHIIKKNRN